MRTHKHLPAIEERAVLALSRGCLQKPERSACPPSAPRGCDQWGGGHLAAAWRAQSVRHRAEGGRGQAAGGDGAGVDGQSPSG